MITEKTLSSWFTYHCAEKEDIEKYNAIRASALAFAKVIIANTPVSADQNAAIRKVREAVMMANASIACNIG